MTPRLRSNLLHSNLLAALLIPALAVACTPAPVETRVDTVPGPVVHDTVPVPGPTVHDTVPVTHLVHDTVTIHVPGPVQYVTDTLQIQPDDPRSTVVDSLGLLRTDTGLPLAGSQILVGQSVPIRVVCYNQARVLITCPPGISVRSSDTTVATVHMNLNAVPVHDSTVTTALMLLDTTPVPGVAWPELLAALLTALTPVLVGLLTRLLVNLTKRIDAFAARSPWVKQAWAFAVATALTVATAVFHTTSLPLIIQAILGWLIATSLHNGSKLNTLGNSAPVAPPPEG